MSHLSRRTFFAASAAVGYSSFAVARAASPFRSTPTASDAANPNFAYQDPALVQAVVGASHAKLDKVKELVEKCPPLARAAWDWGFGDWETALGAASHVGRRDIAAYLISKGARPDIFTFAMLGDLDAVKAFITAQPGIQQVRGPHGITLLQHAKNGGKEAAEVAAYLEALGDADPVIKDEPALTADDFQTYAGTYQIEPNLTFTIKEVKGRLAFQRGEEAQRFLNRHAPHEFSPVGAPEVRLSFQVHNGRAVQVASRNHTADFTAKRTD